jgi:hypothetical protein
MGGGKQLGTPPPRNGNASSFAVLASPAATG